MRRRPSRCRLDEARLNFDFDGYARLDADMKWDVLGTSLRIEVEDGNHSLGVQFWHGSYARTAFLSFSFAS